jgi:hypothetical protein
VGGDALSDVHGDSRHVVLLEFDLAAVQAGADPTGSPCLPRWPQRVGSRSPREHPTNQCRADRTRYTD